MYPLVCCMCHDCGHVQLQCVTDPLQRYTLYDYSYTSANSALSRGHWDECADTVSKAVSLKPGDLVVEVGSNDGYLAQQLAVNHGAQVVGVDPSPAMAALAKSRGVDTIVALFGDGVDRMISDKYGHPKLVVANNVLNHANDPLGFVKAVANLIDVDGWFVFEVLYWQSSVSKGHFDQVYHEHVSHFTVHSLRALLRRVGLILVSVEFINYHGGSLRVFARSAKAAMESIEAQHWEDDEVAQGLFLLSKYDMWRKSMEHQRDAFLKRVYDLRSSNKRIVAIGAAAKGNTVLTYYGLNRFVVDCLTDASPTKQGKFTPLTRVPIVADSELSRYPDGVYAIVLAWNISELLRANLSALNSRIAYLDLPGAK